jgi:hypothetical protein
LKMNGVCFWAENCSVFVYVDGGPDGHFRCELEPRSELQIVRLDAEGDRPTGRSKVEIICPLQTLGLFGITWRTRLSDRFHSTWVPRIHPGACHSRENSLRSILATIQPVHGWSVLDRQKERYNSLDSREPAQPSEFLPSPQESTIKPSGSEPAGRSLRTMSLNKPASITIHDACHDPVVQPEQRRNVTVRQNICMCILFAAFLYIYCVSSFHRAQYTAGRYSSSPWNPGNSITETLFVLQSSQQALEGNLTDLEAKDCVKRSVLEHLCRRVQGCENVTDGCKAIVELLPREQNLHEPEKNRTADLENRGNAIKRFGSDNSNSKPITVEEGMEMKGNTIYQFESTNGRRPEHVLDGFSTRKDSQDSAPNPGSNPVWQPLSVRDKLDYLLGWRGPLLVDEGSI